MAKLKLIFAAFIEVNINFYQSKDNCCDFPEIKFVTSEVNNIRSQLHTAFTQKFVHSRYPSWFCTAALTTCNHPYSSVIYSRGYL